ncbi:MAG: hypothetical protein AAFP93_02445, partial [Bacteroidota bacterium]
MQVACAHIGDPVIIDSEKPLPQHTKKLMVSFTWPEFAMCMREDQPNKGRNNYIKVMLQFSGATNEVVKEFSLIAHTNTDQATLYGKQHTSSKYNIGLKDTTSLSMLNLTSCEGEKSNLVEATIQCIPEKALPEHTPIKVTVTVVRNDKDQKCVLQKQKTLV